MTALDIRNGRMNKAEADKLVAQFEGKRPPSLALFLEYLDLTENEFNNLVLKTVVPPFKPDFETVEDAPKTADFDLWFRETEISD